MAPRTAELPLWVATWNWQPVDRARAYFINAMSMTGNNTMVVWSSAEGPGAGFELQHYLGGSHIDRWLKEKVLLSNSATVLPGSGGYGLRIVGRRPLDA